MSITSYYERMKVGSLRSAQVIVPFLMELLEPHSVVDAGCGTGSWLKVFQEHGVSEILGLDYDGVPRSLLDIPPAQFRVVNLGDELRLGQQFDLALCLEAAHFLPAESASQLVANLTALAPAAMFSAGIPGQGGGGENKQWPEYWAELFGGLGWVCIDCIRPRIWHDPDVEVWYIQNALLFADLALVESRPALAEQHERGRGRPLSIVHPRVHHANRQRLERARRQLAAYEREAPE
jgi:SAM-dependent methyltransferase